MTTFAVTVSNFAIGAVILALGAFLVAWLVSSFRDIERVMKSNQMTFQQVANLGVFALMILLSVVLSALGVMLMIR